MDYAESSNTIICDYWHEGSSQTDDAFDICKCDHQTVGYFSHIATARSCGMLKPGSGRADIYLLNHSTIDITLPKKTTVVEISAANAIPVLLVLKPEENDIIGVEANKKQNQIEAEVIK